MHVVGIGTNHLAGRWIVGLLFRVSYFVTTEVRLFWRNVPIIFIVCRWVHIKIRWFVPVSCFLSSLPYVNTD